MVITVQATDTQATQNQEEKKNNVGTGMISTSKHIINQVGNRNLNKLNV